MQLPNYRLNLHRHRSGDGLVPLGNKPNVDPDLYHHMASIYAHHMQGGASTTPVLVLPKMINMNILNT